MNGVAMSIDGRVAHVTLDRVHRRNAFDTTMLARMEDVIVALERAAGVDVVVLQAEGTSFCAGTDLAELADLSADDTLHWQRRTSDLVERWSRLQATTVTAFNGPAIGSGAVLGLASDLRLAADTFWCEFPELRYGIPLTWSGVALLVRMFGADRVHRMLLLQERTDAARMLGLGLFIEVVDASSLADRCTSLVQQLLAVSPLVRLMTKRAVTAAASAPGFATAAFDPLLAAFAIRERGDAVFLARKGSPR